MIEGRPAPVEEEPIEAEATEPNPNNENMEEAVPAQ
jgi:hypothetical protein